jgi:hypothetical protein
MWRVFCPANVSCRLGRAPWHYLRLLIICVQVIYIEISRYIQTEL